ncbi:hypothetical protein KAT67_03580, partial [candidate division WOR-3 bacterium]|nr:hypothetical protein [candidate division WOR-3 bacterium]
MTDIKIRRGILKMAYERFKEHPYHRITPKELENALNIGFKELNYNIIYLEEKGFIELQKPLEGSIFVGVRISSKGIDLVEDECQFGIMFPINKEQKLMPTHIFAEFNLIIDTIESTNNIDNDLKKLIIEEIKEIQDELKKIEPSYANIKNYLSKIKQKDDNIYEKVMAIIKNPNISSILAESAKR